MYSIFQQPTASALIFGLIHEAYRNYKYYKITVTYMAIRKVQLFAFVKKKEQGGLTHIFIVKIKWYIQGGLLDSLIQ